MPEHQLPRAPSMMRFTWLFPLLLVVVRGSNFVCQSAVVQDGHNDLGSFTSGYTQSTCESACEGNAQCVSYDSGLGECYLSSTRGNTAGGGSLSVLGFYVYCETRTTRLASPHLTSPHSHRTLTHVLSQPCTAY